MPVVREDGNTPCSPAVSLLAYGEGVYENPKFMACRDSSGADTAQGEQDSTALDENRLSEIIESNRVTWINIDGVDNPEVVTKISDVFDFHHLVVEDILNVRQRPKVEFYENALFVVLRMKCPDTPDSYEQLSILMTPKAVLTVQEREGGDGFSAIRDRIRSGRGGFSHRGSDYLVYSIIDSVIDDYFPILENIGEELESLEEEILEAVPTPDLPRRIRDVRRRTLAVRRMTWPVRDLLNTLLRDHNPMVTDETRVYLRDCYDHIIRIIDLIETARETVADLMDLYLSQQNNNMNETMRVLTVLSTIFIPLNFIAGVYGMNFATDASPLNMPELGMYYGYPMVLGVMALVALSIMFAFRRRGWL